MIKWDELAAWAFVGLMAGAILGYLARCVAQAVS